MKIKKHELEKMNSMVENGEMISSVAKQFPKYDYWDIYWAVEDYSLLGKKRSITNRLNKLKKKQTPIESATLIREVKELIDQIYQTSKKNGKKLSNINKIISG